MLRSTNAHDNRAGLVEGSAAPSYGVVTLSGDVVCLALARHEPLCAPDQKDSENIMLRINRVFRQYIKHTQDPERAANIIQYIANNTFHDTCSKLSMDCRMVSWCRIH
jgi:hypothetical protein